MGGIHKSSSTHGIRIGLWSVGSGTNQISVTVMRRDFGKGIGLYNDRGFIIRGFPTKILTAR
jgi:hypothetical protein